MNIQETIKKMLNCLKNGGNNSLVKIAYDGGFTDKEIIGNMIKVAIRLEQISS